MVPCCLSIISCDEHDRLTAQNQGATQIPGGAWGKASYCPKDAAEAHQLWEMATHQRAPGNYLRTIRIRTLRLNIMSPSYVPL